MSHPLQKKIRVLARLARLLTVLYGAGWVICLVVVAAVLLGVLDYLVYLLLRVDDAGVRLIFSLAAAAVAAGGCYRLLVPALMQRWNDIEVARRIERCYPGLRDRLSSSIAFLKQPEDDPTTGSAALRRSVIAETTAYVEQLNLYRALKLRGSIGVALIALLLVAATITTLACCRSARLAAKRLAMPWTATLWPRRNHLQFENPPRRLAAGDDFEVTVIDRNGRLPDSVEFHYWYAGDSRSQTQPMRMLGDKMVARVENVTQSLRYWATGGDDDSMPWHWLEVVEPPKARRVEVRLYPPSYTGWPPAKSGNHIRAIRGTRVKIAGRASKRLRRIQLKLQTAGQTHSLAGRLSDDGRTFSIPADPANPWVIDRSGTYWFEMTGQQGLVGGRRERWQVEAVADHPPAVSLEKPGSNAFVTAQAVVPLEAVVRDDLAIRSIELRFVRSDQTERGEQIVSLYQAGKRPTAGASSNGSHRGELQAQQTIQYDWDLMKVQHLEPGATVRFYIAASDYKPQTGQSTVRRLVILSTDELEDRISQRQSYLLGQLGEALRVQRAARSQTRSLEIQLDETGSLERPHVDRLQSAELNQREVQRLLSAPSDGVASQLVAVLADLDNNRIDSPRVRRRLSSLLVEIRRISRGDLPTVERALVGALKSAREFLHGGLGAEASAERSVPDAVRQPLAEAGRAQDRVIAALERLLGELSEWDNYRRLARQIRRIRREQAAIRRRVDTLRRDLLGKTVEELSPHEKADLKVPARQQRELARQFEATASRLEQIQQQLAEQDPLVAQSIADALDAARRLAIGGQMRDAGRQISQNRLGRATQLQQQVEQGLAELMDLLSNRRQRELDQLVEKLHEAAAELEGLRENAESLRSDLERAAGLAQQQERARQLQRLTKQPRELAERASRVARQLRRLQAEQSAGRAQQAAANLGRSGDAAEQGDAASALKETERAEKQLAEAQAQLDRTIRQAEQELFQEKMARLEQQIAGLVGRQQNVIDETARLDRLRHVQGDLTGEQSASVQSLAREQRALAIDTARLAEKLEDAEALALALRGAGRQMVRAASQLDRAQTGAPTQQAEQMALARLMQLLAALKMDEGQTPQANAPAAGKPGQPPSAGAMQRLVQLKLLQLMQVEINRRTAQLEEARLRRGGTLSDQQQGELEQLIAEQGRLAELVFNLSEPVEARPEDDPEHLPPVGLQGGFDNPRNTARPDALLPKLQEH